MMIPEQSACNMHNVTFTRPICPMCTMEAKLDATEHALEFALKRLEKISAERIKEIEAHRATTLKLVKLQEKR